MKLVKSQLIWEIIFRGLTICKQQRKRKKEEKILLGLRGQNSIFQRKKVTKNEEKNIGLGFNNYRPKKCMLNTIFSLCGHGKLRERSTIFKRHPSLNPFKNGPNGSIKFGTTCTQRVVALARQQNPILGPNIF